MAECGHAMKEINKVQISPIDENGKGKGKGKDKEVSGNKIVCSLFSNL